MGMSSCSCCQESGQCPEIGGWITLHTWRGNRTIPNDLRDAHLSPFRLRFNFGTDEVTATLPVDSEIADVQAALAGLPNIGANPTVTTANGVATVGSLKSHAFWITFDTPLTNNQDVPTLEVLDTDSWEVGVVQEGVAGVSPEIQLLTRKPGVWDDLQLDKWQNAVWMWRIVVLNTGDVVDDTELCLAQNRRAHRPWTAPAGGVDGFTAEYEPLQVGTTWQGRIRTGYGEPIKRSIRESSPADVAENGCDDLNNVDLSVAKADFNADDGTVSLTASRPFEFALQIECLGCHYAQEFALWGEGEQGLLRFTGIYNLGDTGQGAGLCPNWSEEYSNTPYLAVRPFGVDGVDGHLRREAFFADGGVMARETVCTPDVVLLGDGCYVEQYLSAKFDPKTCAPGVTPCPNEPRLEYLLEQSVSGLHRLKSLYGSDFSYWGGWIDYVASRAAGMIVTRFEEYDLTDVKVLFLGGLMAGSMGALAGKFGDTSRYQRGSDLVNFDFAPGSLESLKRWLDQGERVLVLDGGIWPQKFFAGLGLSSTVEPFGDYIPDGGSVTDNTLNFRQWGPELPSVPPSSFQELYVEAVPHPFTTNVGSAIDTGGNAVLVSDFTFSGQGIAGQPPGTGHVTRGLITLSQKWPFDMETKPAAGLRSYTSAVPVVTPGPDADVIGRVKGSVPVAPFLIGPTYVTVPVDYPGIVCETWKGSFRLRFDHNGTVETTVVLPPNATAGQVQAELALLANIGPGFPSVLGGPLPNPITITFDTALTQLQDVNELEVLDSGCWSIETYSDGVPGSGNEVQRLIREHVPSRAIVSQVTELIAPDGWGKNWDTVSAGDIGTPGGGALPVGQTGYEGQPYQKVVTLSGCSLVPLTFYDKRGYGWGLGLSSTAAAQFLLNLRDRRTEWWA